MALLMDGEVELRAKRELVWSKLNDPEVLKACIPGCEELERTSDNECSATAKIKVGPISARFNGQVTLSDFDPPPAKEMVVWLALPKAEPRSS
jgi:carbon monoxide dehydrogenase subunit G